MQGKHSMYYQVDIKHQKFYILNLIKVIRTLSQSLKLKEAQDICTYISNHKCTLVAGISLDIANHIHRQFLEFGVIVEVNESSISSPMLLSPNTNFKWQWGDFRAIKKAI